MPNLYTLRGTKYRDIALWIQSIDKMRELNADYMVPSHTRPVIGADNVYEALTAYRDGIAYLYHQTIRHANKGLTPDELVEVVKLPPYLRDHPWLQERYGEAEWHVRGIFSGEIGWFNGDAAFLKPVAQNVRGEKIVEGFGGVEKTLGQIQKAIDNGEYEWAAELATYVLFADPDNEAAKLLKAHALRVLGWRSDSSGGRNWYITQALELEGKIKVDSSKLNFGDPEVAKITPNEILLSQIPSKLNPNKSGDTMMILGIYLEDVDEGHTLEVRRAVAEYRPSFPENYDISVTSTSDIFKKIFVGELELSDAVESGDVKVEGNTNDLLTFIGFFDDGLESSSFGIAAG